MYICVRNLLKKLLKLDAYVKSHIILSNEPTTRACKVILSEGDRKKLEDLLKETKTE